MNAYLTEALRGIEVSVGAKIVGSRGFCQRCGRPLKRPGKFCSSQCSSLAMKSPRVPKFEWHRH